MITTAEVAARLGITPRMVLKLIEKGLLPARKIGRDWLIDESNLELVKVRNRVGYPQGRPRK